MTGSQETKQTSRRSLAAKHVFDVLILNWAPSKHQLARLYKRIKITNILEAENYHTEINFYP